MTKNVLAGKVRIVKTLTTYVVPLLVIHVYHPLNAHLINVILVFQILVVQMRCAVLLKETNAYQLKIANVSLEIQTLDAKITLFVVNKLVSALQGTNVLVI